jgi:hypothetical protein
MRLTVRRELDAHFVEADQAGTQSFIQDGVAIRVNLSKPPEASFAAITCVGALDLARGVGPRDVAQSAVAPLDDGHALVAPGGLDVDINDLVDGYRRIDSTLEQVGALLRWRFSLSGKDSLFKESSVTLLTDGGRSVELNKLGTAAMGDDAAHVCADELGELRGMCADGCREPLAHQLWREAWNLRHGNPRASLVTGVAAAEVGMKHLVAVLVPHARWLVEELPSPPLVSMVKNYLPDLPICVDVRPDRRSPAHLRRLLDEAVVARNRVIHRGETPAIFLRATLAGVREFLYLLDFYGGQPWARAQLSAETLASLGLEHAD